MSRSRACQKSDTGRKSAKTFPRSPCLGDQESRVGRPNLEIGLVGYKHLDDLLGRFGIDSMFNQTSVQFCSVSKHVNGFLFDCDT